MLNLNRHSTYLNDINVTRLSRAWRWIDNSSKARVGVRVQTMFERLV